ncbi:hypothetical protein B296_00027735 [Ensete ventricosum]|uniref:Uncharacterized protein n=1 Tax=Ensete ventricosum TaxID=4639 RepID=A0A427A4E5_ENSVE|nr:hypothetical protein B296_00027735 [Ensete ventricosum]
MSLKRQPMATAVGRVSPRPSWCSLAWTTYSTTSGSTMAHQSATCVTPSTQAVATPAGEVASDERVSSTIVMDHAMREYKKGIDFFGLLVAGDFNVNEHLYDDIDGYGGYSDHGDRLVVPVYLLILFSCVLLL